MTEVIKKRNLVLPVGIASLLVIIGVLAGIYFLSPSNYISLDVNPSIEIQTNRLNNVVSVNPMNEDAKQLMAGYDLKSKNLEDVIKDIVDRMILGEYLSPDKDNQILITSEDKKASAELSKNVNDIISTYLTEKQLNANLIQQSIKVTNEDVQNAHENKVSVGKMELIEQLMKNDTSLTFEDLSNKRISDLMTLAETKNIGLEGLTNQEDVNVNDNQDESNVNDDQEDINNVDDEELNDDQEDTNNVDDEDLNDDQEDTNNVDDEDLNDDQEDTNNVDDEDLNDDQEDIDNTNNTDDNDSQGNDENAAD